MFGRITQLKWDTNEETNTYGIRSYLTVTLEYIRLSVSESKILKSKQILLKIQKDSRASRQNLLSPQYIKRLHQKIYVRALSPNRIR